MSTASPQLDFAALHTVKVIQRSSLRLYSNTTYKYSQGRIQDLEQGGANVVVLRPLFNAAKAKYPAMRVHNVKDIQAAIFCRFIY